MTRSYFDMFGPPSLQADDVIVLDTREKIKPLLKAIAEIPGLTWDDTEVIQRVMQSIQIESRGLDQLHNDCLELISRATGIHRYDMVATPQGWRKVAVTQAQYRTDFITFGDTRDPNAGYTSPEPEVPWFNEATRIAALLTELGAYLFAYLRSIGCYERGYLYYQFKDWLGYDMLLIRFEPDLESLR